MIVVKKDTEDQYLLRESSTFPLKTFFEIIKN